jgi:hypothetical protein
MTIDREPPIAVFLFADPTVDAVRQSPTQRHSLCHSDEVRGSEFKKNAARRIQQNVAL